MKVQSKHFKISTSEEAERFIKILQSEIKSVSKSSHLATSEDFEKVKKALEKHSEH